MKLYTFINQGGELITEIKAENHDEAVKKANTNGEEITYHTDFFSESLDGQK